MKKKDRDAVRNYITQHVPGTHITFGQRQTLAADWNEIIRAGRRITLCQFAAKHGLRYETWRREYNRGAAGEAVPDARDRRRRKYAEYDPLKETTKMKMFELLPRPLGSIFRKLTHFACNSREHTAEIHPSAHKQSARSASTPRSPWRGSLRNEA